uniref:Uncharacterized protein n=1 Tax=Cyprinus carpio TaxID=7962 RepID=A0A8C2H752_CYPCA
ECHPCSEDSGLDDTSYRSPYDEPETPVEREIREALEREENFKRERAMAKMSVGDTMQVKARPGVLNQSRSQPGDKGQMFDTLEDRSRSQRSLSAKTPTLSVTGTSGRRPSYHEMIANNVIILQPDSYPTKNNPFFKLRFHSTQSLVAQEIKLVRQREEELRRQRFPEAPYPRVRRKSALAQRWEAGIFANHQQQD